MPVFGAQIVLSTSVRYWAIVWGGQFTDVLEFVQPDLAERGDVGSGGQVRCCGASALMEGRSKTAFRLRSAATEGLDGAGLPVRVAVSSRRTVAPADLL